MHDMKNAIRNLALMAMPAAMVFGLSACQEDETRPERPEVNQNDIVFEAKAGALTSESATITIKHNGTDNETYYGFCYTDLETTMANAINRVVASFTENGTDISTVVTTGTTHVTVVTDLSPLTSYRYVVFGLNDDGTVYGTPASVDFTTLKGEVAFTVSVANITETTANATVTSTGDDTDTWYCFATTDLTSPLADVVSAEVERLGSNVSSVIKSGNSMVQLTGLTAGTSYRAVVTGLTSDGTTYGTPVSTSFRTTSQQVEYTVNPNWTVTYDGKGTYEGSPADMLSVTVTAGTDGYMPGVITTEQFESIGIATFVEGMVASYQEQIDFMNQMGIPISWSDILYTSTETELPFDVLDSSTQWYGIAFGVDTNGNPTGLYAISEAFTPEELQASENYNRWIGSWRIEDADGTGYDISIQALSPDMSFSMSGWEADVFGGQAPDVTLGFDSATGNLAFVSNENMGTITVNGNEQCELGFYGTGDDGYFYTSSYDIAYAELDESGNTATVEGNTLTSSEGEVTMISMQFFGLGTSGNYSFSDEPLFPLTMTRTSSSSGTALQCTKAVMYHENSGFRTMSPLKMYGTDAVKKAE